MLVVRPSGSLAYYAARKLLAALDQPMGYELVAEDWQLDLPPADPAATAACRDAIDRLMKERERIMSILRDGPQRSSDGRIIQFDNRTGLLNVEEGDDDGRSGDGRGFENPQGFPEDSRGPLPTGRDLTPDDVPYLRRDGRGDGSSPFGSSAPAAPHGDADTGVPPGSDPARPMTDASGRLPAFPGTGPDGRPVQPAPRQQPIAQQRAASAQPQGSQPQPFQQPSPQLQRAQQPVAKFGTPLSDQFNPTRGAQASPGGGTGVDAGQAWDSPARGGADSGNQSGGASGPQATGDTAQQRRSSTTASSDASGTKQAKVYEFGGSSERSLDESTPDDEFPTFGAPNTLQGRSPSSQHLRNRRWGLYGPKATIGFERQITLRVEPDQQVRSWGWPPQNFYWVPSIRFIVYPGANQHYEQLHERMRFEGLSSTVELQLKPAEPVSNRE